MPVKKKPNLDIIEGLFTILRPTLSEIISISRDRGLKKKQYSEVIKWIDAVSSVLKKHARKTKTK